MTFKNKEILLALTVLVGSFQASPAGYGKLLNATQSNVSSGNNTMANSLDMNSSASGVQSVAMPSSSATDITRDNVLMGDNLDSSFKAADQSIASAAAPAAAPAPSPNDVFWAMRNRMPGNAVLNANDPNWAVPFLQTDVMWAVNLPKSAPTGYAAPVTPTTVAPTDSASNYASDIPTLNANSYNVFEKHDSSESNASSQQDIGFESKYENESSPLSEDTYDDDISIKKEPSSGYLSTSQDATPSSDPYDAVVSNQQDITSHSGYSALQPSSQEPKEADSIHSTNNPINDISEDVSSPLFGASESDSEDSKFDDELSVPNEDSKSTASYDNASMPSMGSSSSSNTPGNPSSMAGSSSSESNDLQSLED